MCARVDDGAGADADEGAREFLAYFYKPENLATYLEPGGNVPPRTDLPPSKDPLVNAAVESLKQVKGTSQYYDRDSDPDMAQAGLVGFQEFMAKPESTRHLYEIQTAPQPPLVTDTLSAEHVAELARLREFL